MIGRSVGRGKGSIAEEAYLNVPVLTLPIHGNVAPQQVEVCNIQCHGINTRSPERNTSRRAASERPNGAALQLPIRKLLDHGNPASGPPSHIPSFFYVAVKLRTSWVSLEVYFRLCRRSPSLVTRLPT